MTFVLFYSYPSTPNLQQLHLLKGQVWQMLQALINPAIMLTTSRNRRRMESSMEISRHGQTIRKKNFKTITSCRKH